MSVVLLGTTYRWGTCCCTTRRVAEEVYRFGKSQRTAIATRLIPQNGATIHRQRLVSTPTSRPMVSLILDCSSSSGKGGFVSGCKLGQAETKDVKRSWNTTPLYREQTHVAQGFMLASTDRIYRPAIVMSIRLGLAPNVWCLRALPHLLRRPTRIGRASETSTLQDLGSANAGWNSSTLFTPSRTR